MTSVYHNRAAPSDGLTLDTDCGSVDPVVVEGAPPAGGGR